MDTLEFLQRVLPPSGFYVALTINGDQRRQGFFATVDQLAKAVTGLNQQGLNTYYAISSFVQKGNRKQDNVQATKVIALDVDCGESKPFATWKEGLQALGKFVSSVGLPKPMVIHSGNGLHVYWVMDAALEPAQWKPLAEGMKAAAKAQQFNIDWSVPADSARVLRPVNTINTKSNTSVKLLIDAEPTSYKEIRQSLSPYISLIIKHKQSSTHTNTLLGALAVKQNYPPANPVVVAAKCQQIDWATKNQKDISEPLWYALMGVAAHCENDVATAIAWSQAHPGFSQDETIAKLEHWKSAASGPTTCSKLEELRPGGCRGCKYKDKIGSPTRLGIQYVEVPPAATVPDTIDTSVPLPKPFKRTHDGIKMTIDETDIDVCKFDIYPVAYGRDESLGYETVRFMWNRPHAGWQEVAMRQALLTDGHRDFSTVLADNGIVLLNRNQTGHFQYMLRAYMEELRQRRAMTNLYTTMGWKENFTQFVIGDTILRRNPDNTVVEESTSLASISNRLGHELWETEGTLDGWVNFTSLLAKADLRAHMFALAIGFSAPLYAFTGLKGLTVSLYGPTGGGKSLAQLWIQSIYGNPEKLHFAAKFTQNTLFGRMGLYANMPMTIDEVTMMEDKEVGDFAYWVSQGRDKARMNRNAEERDAKTWALPVVVSTNKSMHSKLVASGLDTDAQLARILEISVPPSPIFTRDSTAGRKIYEFVTSNYGLVGREFLKRLVELGDTGIRAAIADATENFRSRYRAEFTGEERFWEQAIILADLAARLAREWGLIAFDHRTSIEWVLSQVGAIRRAVAEFKVDAFDVVTEYLNEFNDAALTVMYTGSTKPSIDYTRLPRGELRIRFELFRKASSDAYSHGVVYLDRAHFRRWLSQRGADYKTLLDDLQQDNALTQPKSNKVYLGKDSPIKLGQTYVVGVNLSHPRMQGILNDMEQAYEDLTLGRLKSVIPH